MKKIDKEKADKLWLDGKLDTEIAEHLNCSQQTVYNWRKKNGLRNNKAIASRNKNSVRHEQLTKLWEDGLKDSEIAKELKCSTITVWKYREDNGMGSNVGIFNWS
jgi:uncharacterized protein YjcR